MKVACLILIMLLTVPTAFSQNPNRVGGLVDRIMQRHLRAHEMLSGGEISVFYNDSIILRKGYGYAVLENKIPFVPQQTLVQLASVTKLITTTAVLQLIGHGKLELDRPVADYIGNDIISNPFKTNITVRHLLTHTAGLDDRSTLMYAGSKDHLIPLDKYIEHYLPGVVWEPGKFFNYSNHAFNLLAYLVQKVSGMPYDQFVKKQVLQPLGMNASGVGYDLPNMNRLMKRYNLKADEAERTWQAAVPLSYTQMPGADDFKTTATDMEHFMEMYLHKGTFRQAQVLSPGIISQAFSPAFSYDESMQYKQGLGWRILDRKGFRCLYHEGDDKGIEAAIYLYPQHQLGIFMVFNNQVGFEAKREIRDSIENVLLPVQQQAPLSYRKYTNPGSLAGRYYYMNDAQLNFEKIVYLFKGNSIEVSVQADTLQIGGKNYLEYKPLVFDKVNGEGQAIFLPGENGQPKYLSFGTSTYHKLPWLQQPETHRQFLLIALAVLIVSFLVSLVAAVIRNRRNILPAYRYQGSIQISSVLILGFITSFALYIDHMHIGEDIPASFKILMAIPVLAAIFFLMGIYGIFKIIQLKHYPVFFRGLWIVQLVSISVILWILNFYHFLGWHFY